MDTQIHSHIRSYSYTQTHKHTHIQTHSFIHSHRLSETSLNNSRRWGGESEAIVWGVMATKHKLNCCWNLNWNRTHRGRRTATGRVMISSCTEVGEPLLQNLPVRNQGLQNDEKNNKNILFMAAAPHNFHMRTTTTPSHNNDNMTGESNNNQHHELQTKNNKITGIFHGNNNMSLEGGLEHVIEKLSSH